MVGVVVHAVVYLAVNALLVFVWRATSGSAAQLDQVTADPLSNWRDAGFWPIWPIVAWGTVLAIHAGSWLAYAVLGGPRRRRRRRAMRRAAHHALLHPPEPSATPAPPAPVPPQSPPAAPGRQRVAVLFTDIVGSTDLAEQLGDEEWGEILADHRRTVREVVAEHDGTEVGTQGDGFLVRFGDAGSAVACAMALQRRLEHERNAGGLTPQLRIGVHAGEAVHDDGDLVGRVVNLAARVTGAAEPGEILVTEPVADQLLTAAGLDDRGLVPLRGVSTPRHLLAVRWRDEMTTTTEPTPTT